MKNSIIFFCAVLAVMLGSCSSARIPSSVWYSVTPFAINGESGYNVTSLHFLDKDIVVINGAAVEGDTLIAPAQLIATGTYKIDKKLKDGYTMSLNAETVFNDSIHFKGVICEKGIALSQPGKEALIFNLCKNYKIRK
ncbi:MAG: hypothetical protein K2J12_05925 [Muribaculaceae bacterium]|nr:hypothetical protein [Muribaculaceae bacterium]